MADPSIVKIKEGTVEKIATSAYKVIITKHRFDQDIIFYVTTRETGSAAPTLEQIAAEGMPLFKNFDIETIESSYNADFYLYCDNGKKTTEWGEVVVWDAISFNQVLSFSKTGIVATDYAKDAIAAGKGFQIQRIFTISDSAPLYLVLDTTGMVGSGKSLALMPLMLNTAGGNVKVETYPIESYTGGNEIKFARLNSTIENFALSKFYSGATPTGEPGDEYREYSIGTLSTHQASGGGSIIPDIPKMFPAGSIITAKCSTVETSDIILDFGLIIFEY